MSDENPTTPQPHRRVSKARFAHWAGWIGGSVFCIVNLTTGLLPGGFLGFMAGAIITYGLVYLILTVWDV